MALSYVALAIRKLSTTEPIWLIALNFFYNQLLQLASLFTIPIGWKMPSVQDFSSFSYDWNNLGGFANLWLKSII